VKKTAGRICLSPAREGGGGVRREGAARILRASLSLLCHAGPAWTCPPAKAGTLVVTDVSALTIGQQVTLFDWLNHGRRENVQVVVSMSYAADETPGG